MNAFELAPQSGDGSLGQAARMEASATERLSIKNQFLPSGLFLQLISVDR
ncbi:hypothetical protein [Mesorhizobium sp. L-8-10]|jgi:hypothetical protein|nr:hypothetical protein [Mesorhizobium sp. L-8-10]